MKKTANTTTATQNTKGETMKNTNRANTATATETTTKKELQPKYEAVASYYGKAWEEIQTTGINLYSYGEKIAEKTTDKNGDNQINIITDIILTKTSMRHLKEWIKQQGHKAENRKQILKDYKKTN